MFEGGNVPGQSHARKPSAAANGDGDANESLSAIKRVLRNVMVHEKSVITSWCSRNSSQMRGALESVVTMQEQADRMGVELSASHQNLRVRCSQHRSSQCIHALMWCPLSDLLGACGVTVATACRVQNT